MGDATRLVGAGRLAVEVPADWPTVGFGPVTRSCVQIIPSVVPAVAYPPPPPGVVAIQPRQDGRISWVRLERPRLRPLLDRCRRTRVGAVDALVPRRTGGWPFWAFACPPLGGAFDFTGDAEIAWEVFATAHELPEHLVAVPELSRRSGRVVDSDPHDVRWVTRRLGAAGLSPVVADHVPADVDCYWIDVDPPEGSVVERGSEVRYTITTDGPNED